MTNEAANADHPVITFKGTDIRELPPEILREAIRDGYSTILDLQARLSDEGRMEAAREEDFARGVRDRKDFFGTAAEYTSRIFDTSTAYNQIIILSGYVAFFSVWSAFAKDISRTILIASGILIIISLTVYITWTVLGMYQLALRNMEAVASFEAGIDGFVERIQAVEIASKTRGAALQKYWKKVLWASGLPAFAAATILSGTALWTIIPAQKPTRPDPIAIALKQATAAAKKAECSARMIEIYTRSRGGPGSTAYNQKTKQHAVLVGGKWVTLPSC